VRVAIDSTRLSRHLDISQNRDIAVSRYLAELRYRGTSMDSITIPTKRVADRRSEASLRLLLVSRKRLKIRRNEAKSRVRVAVARSTAFVFPAKIRFRVPGIRRTWSPESPSFTVFFSMRCVEVVLSGMYVLSFRDPYKMDTWS